jgi:hypothetical protein
VSENHLGLIAVHNLSKLDCVDGRLKNIKTTINSSITGAVDGRFKLTEENMLFTFFSYPSVCSDETEVIVDIQFLDSTNLAGIAPEERINIKDLVKKNLLPILKREKIEVIVSTRTHTF